MKKIIKILTVLMAFFTYNKVCLAYIINKGEAVEDIKISIKTSDNIRIENIYKIYREDTSELLYSINPEITSYRAAFDDYNYDGGMNYLDYDIKEQIANIVYYGYGYQNRNDIKWYAITQYLIWDELLKRNGEINFVDENNNKIEPYQKEIEQILNDISHHKDMPSFIDNNSNNYIIKLNENIILEDSYNILKNYDIIGTTSDLECIIKDNKIIITPLNPTSDFLNFTKKVEKLPQDMKIYINEDKQRYIGRGNINQHTGQMIISVIAPKVTIKNNSYQDKYSLEGAKYNIYTEDGNIYYGNIGLNESGISKEYTIWPGKYYLEEVEIPHEYKENEDKIYFEIKKDDLIVNISNDLIKNNETLEEPKEEITENERETNIKPETGSIIINKIDPVTGSPLKGIKYGLYNKDKELIKEETTNSEGKIIFKNLETGKYYIKEIINENNKELDENAIEIEVKNNIDSILTSSNRTKIDVPNTISYEINYSYIYYIVISVIGIYFLKYEKAC